jgi:2-haloalkanoic acid dehalogenase type II
VSTQPIDYGSFDVVTFDCYGTLIDWEVGLTAGLRDALGANAAGIPDDELLESYGRHETAAEGGPYQPYRAILAAALQGMAGELGARLADGAAERFGGSVIDWPPFPDSPAALRVLAGRYRLGVLTNCDDDLFAASNERLGVELDWVITAEQVRAYKPDEAHFRALFERLAGAGMGRERVLHVAQSLFHDHEPAKRLGLTTVWIDRRHGRSGTGATPPSSTRPDATFPSMEAFASAAVVDWGRG